MRYTDVSSRNRLQEIMGRTGHISEKAVQKYKMSSDAISENVPSVWEPSPPRKSHSIKCESEVMNIEDAEKIDFAPVASKIHVNCDSQILKDITEK